MSDTNSRVIGRVKWFNNKVGYGFISITEGEHKGSDIFVHHSVIEVSDQQYKYLVQGEYVELRVVLMKDGKYEYQANEVMGLRGGKLMCETRNESKQARDEYVAKKFDNNEESKPKAPRRGGGPRETPQEDGQGWTTKSNKSDAPKRRGRPPKVDTTASVAEAPASAD